MSAERSYSQLNVIKSRSSGYFCCKLFQIAIQENILAHPIEYLKGVGPQRADLLKKELGIFTFNDLLHHFPYRHIDRTKIHKIIDLNPSIEFAQVKGTLLYSEVVGEKSAKRLMAYLKDDTGIIELTWFKGINWVEKPCRMGRSTWCLAGCRFS
jgi:ATP-dependent DNA helicase RecG